MMKRMAVFVLLLVVVSLTLAYLTLGAVFHMPAVIWQYLKDREAA